MNLTEIGIKNTLDFIDINQVSSIYEEAKTRPDNAWKQVKELFTQGFSVDELVNAFYRYGMDPQNKMPDALRARFLKVVAQAHAKIAAGISSPIQVAKMIVELGEAK